MGTAEVVAEQKLLTHSNSVYVRCHLTKSGQTTYTYATNDGTNKILRVEQIQEPYREEVKVVLSNADQALTAIDLRGYKLTLGLGFILSGSPDYINQAPSWVVNQEFDSAEGVLTCTLTCYGIMSMMYEERASDDYIPEDDTDPSAIADDILDGTLAACSHCTAYTTDWSGITKATDIDFWYPAGGFKVSINTNRLLALRRLLDNSYVFPRPQNDDKVYLIRPTISGEVYDYEYSLTAPDHRFLTKIDANKKLFPDKVYVYGGEYDESAEAYEYSGSSGSGDYDYYTHYEDLTSDGQCATLAAAILANITINQKTCEALVPMNCTAKLFDYCKITDTRESSSVTGNLGYIKRIYESGKFTMLVRFGGWASERRLNQQLAASKRESPTRDLDYEWISLSCPDTYLEPGDMIYLGRFYISQSISMYIKAANIFNTSGNVNVNLVVEFDSQEVWSIGGARWFKAYHPCVAHDADSGGIWNIYIENSHEDAVYANGMITLGFR